MAFFTFLFHLEVDDQLEETALDHGLYPDKAREQSAWPSLPALAFIGISSLLLLMPPTFRFDSGLINKINITWTTMIDSIP